MTLKDVKERIDKNYLCIKKTEELIPLQADENENMNLISLIGFLYSTYVTGVYSSSDLEKHLIDIGKNIQFKLREKNQKVHNNVLIVMTKGYYVGGHTVLVNNWIKYDCKRKYTVVFTDQSYLDVPKFIIEAVKQSGGEVVCLNGNSLDKASQLLDISQNFERILLFTHMNDIIPILAYSRSQFKVPVYFYNHADFRFSFGFSIADIIMDLTKFDVDKTIRYRGIEKERSVYLPFPGGGKLKKSQVIIDRKKVRNEIDRLYDINAETKLIVSMGSDFKYEKIIDYDFGEYVKKVIELSSCPVQFLIIGADKTREKWIKLEEETNGRARALGVLPYMEAERLIAGSDLYIVSFPMLAEGSALADVYRVPRLRLNIIGRGINKEDIRTAMTVEELIDKSLEVIDGHKDKYLCPSDRDTWSTATWNERWDEIYDKNTYHQIHEIRPHRLIEKQEYVNCQLMQKTAGNAVRDYLNKYHFNEKIREQIYILDHEYDMGIFPNGIYQEYDNVVVRAKRNYTLFQNTIMWIQLKQMNKAVDVYLYNKGYRTVAIYGMGYMGQTLANDLNNGLTKVVYGIDQYAGNLQWGIKICNPSEQVEEVDVIINTTTTDNYQILTTMKVQSIPMLSLQDVLYNMLNND